MKDRSSYRILYRYILVQFAQNFAVAFAFFFCIFFINSILLLVQRILLRNIDMMTMLSMVSLSMPQFLIYTFPFASLAASSMILGDLGSSNELLAIRSSGISLSHVYRPLIAVSIFLSFVTFLFADIVHPWASSQYSVRLAQLMQDMPTFEIEPNSVNTVGNIVLQNGQSEGNEIHDIVLLSTEENGESRTVISERGVLELIDSDNYVYSLSLDNPTILLSESDDISSYGLSSAEKATFFLDFSEQIPSLTSTSPVNLSSRDLITGIRERAPREREGQMSWHEGREEAKLMLSDAILSAFAGDIDRATLSDRITSAREDVGTYGEYPPLNTTFIPAMAKQDVRLSAKKSFIVSHELRAKMRTSALPPAITTIARLEEVSTVSGTVGIIRITPFWQAISVFTILSWISSGESSGHDPSS